MCTTRTAIARRVCVYVFRQERKKANEECIGKKCKFSHDLSIERKAVKKNLYEDGRDEESAGDKKEETMENWDEEKLRSVVMSKHGNPKTTTDKVCKFFIEAVENGKYGWFWQCMPPTRISITLEIVALISDALSSQVQMEAISANINILCHLVSF